MERQLFTAMGDVLLERKFNYQLYREYIIYSRLYGISHVLIG